MTIFESKTHKKAITSMMAFLILLTLTILPVQASGPEPQEAQTGSEFRALLYFALEGESAQPETKQRTHFECSDKIFVVLELENTPLGKQNLSFRWNDPKDEEKERVDYPFTVTEKTTRLWAWLNLIRSRGAGMITWINPAAGLEEFIGPWTVDAYVDDKKVATSSFSVDC